jgi:hypothetical protein
MWKTIENSYFWLTYSRKQRSLTLRILNPLSTKVRVFRFFFSQEVINLIDDGTEDERICRQRTNARLERERLAKEKEREQAKAMATAQQQVGRSLERKS